MTATDLARGRANVMSHRSEEKNFPPLIGVIDPEPVSRAGLRDLLRRTGADVSTYDSAESYLRADPRIHPACLIVDILLPGMSGLELLRRLRDSKDRVPVILLADETDVPTAVAAMREGAADFIEKPFVDAAVLRHVSKLLGNSDDALSA
jgi:FixJ family two-component response regulator